MRGGLIGNSVKTVVGVGVMPFLTALNAVGNGSDYVSDLFFEYNTMRNTLDENQSEFAALQNRTAQFYEYRAENERLRTMLVFERTETQYKMVPAEVIQHADGVLTIDRGRAHGIQESMCVVTPDGIIGLVRHVGPFTSNVVTLQSTDCRVDAMIEWNRVRGQVQGTGSDLSSVCSMHYIDLNHSVKDNDLIVTSPDSVFPSGFPIGRVVGTSERGHLSQSARIMPFADPFSVDEVFVLLAADTSAIELAGGPSPEIQRLVDQGLVDTGTIQERYAP